MLRSGSIEQERGRKKETTNAKNDLIQIKEESKFRNVTSTITTQSPIYTTLKVNYSFAVCVCVKLREIQRLK